ncbi:MAG: sodium:proton exchanger [Bacteroidetes bacterium QS_9_68_14]|nr:MAG: sodium:proton exchanger [Bacteroidetes bacterium QS_9_68_14]
MHAILVGIALVIVLGVSAQWLAWRFQLPSILLLLTFGFVAGPVAGLLDPQALQGNWVFAFVSLSIGIILFEAGLTLRLDELREVGAAVRNLITIGVAVTWAGAGLGAYYLTGFRAELAVLVGAILTVTGPTVVVPLLRHVRPTGRVGTIAKWEGITIDPIGAILAVLVLDAILFFQEEAVGQVGAVLHAAEELVTVVVVGVGVSGAGAALLVWLLRRRLIPDYLQNAVALMVVVGAFALSDTLQAESGLLTTTLMGIIVTNQPYVSVRGLAEFKEDLQVLLLAALFIVLSARLELAALAYVDGRALLLLAVLIVVVRPLAVWVSSWGTPLDWREWAFLSWLAPRGVVATAVASLFAFRLQEIYPAAADRLAPIIFLMIVGTVAVYGLTLAPVARGLQLAQPNPQGVLIVGAHDWARTIAKALDEQGLRVMVIDSHAGRVHAARQEGLLAQRANALSEQIIDELDLSGIGRLVALTPNGETNALAALHFAEVFDSAEVYQIPTRTEREHERAGGDLPRHLRGRALFDEGVTYTTLADRFEAGAQVRPFRLTESRTYEALREHYGEALLPLFLVREPGRVRVFAEAPQPVPQPGDTLLAFVQETDEGPPALPSHAEQAGRERRDEEAVFDDVVERAPVIDLSEAVTYNDVVERAAALLAERTPVDADELADQHLTGREKIVISRGAALPHMRTPAVEHPEMVIVRCQSGLCIEFEEQHLDAGSYATGEGTRPDDGHASGDGHAPAQTRPVFALFFLVSPEAHPGRHLHLLAEIASRIDDGGFQEAWRAAEGEAAIKDVLRGEAVSQKGDGK